MHPYINIHTHYTSDSEGVIEVVDRNLDVEANNESSYGLHPWGLLDAKNDLILLEKKIKESNCIAIGECGLDRVKSDVTLSVQEDVFIKQLELAKQVNKPVIIHCVKAFDRLMPIIKKYGANISVIIHGFNNNIEILKRVRNDNVKFSFGKALFKEGSNAQKCIKQLYLHEFFLETDNEVSLSIEEVYLKASSLLGIELEVLKEEMYKNYKGIIHAGF